MTLTKLVITVTVRPYQVTVKPYLMTLRQRLTLVTENECSHDIDKPYQKFQQK